MTKELDTITQPIQEANWTMFKRIFKMIPITLIIAACMFSAYKSGEYLTHQQYSYTKFLPKGEVRIARYSDTFCKGHGVCDRDAVLKVLGELRNNAEASYILGKI